VNFRIENMILAYHFTR